MKQVVIFVDGACANNPGRGGWACLLVFKNVEKMFVGFNEDTTNNQMELSALMKGLSFLKEKCRVSIYSDSNLLVSSIRDGFLKKWSMNGWKKSDGKAVKNQELWSGIWDLLNVHDLGKISWVPAHTKRADGSFKIEGTGFENVEDEAIDEVVGCLGNGLDANSYVLSRNDWVDRAAVYARDNEIEGQIDITDFL